MSIRKSIVVTAGASVVVFLQVGAASAGEIVGRVTDSVTGRPLPNATVRIQGTERTAIADRSGEYRIIDVPAGNYTIEVSSVGFNAGTQSVTVPATGAVTQAFTLAAGGLEEITVTGFRLSQATALQDKKAAAVIKDSVTADDAGKLPDQNAAEALQRLPGVSTTVDQGEGRYVTIRGIDPGLNNVTLDNQILATPEGDTRRIALDTVPANLLSKLEVVKAVTPDMDGNSIGGAINIVTPSAFDDPDGRFANASVEYGYYDLNSENSYGGSAAWGQTFGAEDRWGIVLSGSYSEREYASHNLQGGDPWEEGGAFLIPDVLDLRDYTIERIRSGVVANLEFRPNDATKLYLRNLYNEFEDTEVQPETIYDYRNGDLEDQTTTHGTFTEGEGSREVQSRNEKQSIQTSTLGGDFGFGAWTLSGALTYGEAEQDTPWDFGWVFELDEAIPMTYDTSSFFFDVTAGPEFQDAELFEFEEMFRAHQIVEEELKIAQLDLKRDFVAWDRDAFVKVGAKFVDREKESDQDMDVYDGFDGDLLLSDVSQPGDPDFYCSERCYEFGPKVDFDAAQRFYDANSAAFELNDADTIAESFGVDYTISEEVTAGYLMGQIDLIPELTLIGGVRVERTESDFSAFDLEFVDGDIDPAPPQVTGSKSYTNWLPGLQARYSATPDLLVRAAWTNTIGRPSYEQNVPFRIFETEAVEDDDGEVVEGVFEGAIEMGNADLDPLESMNLDLSVEYYLQPSGVMAVGIFYKDIDNPIFTRVQQLEEVDFEGRFYEELEIVQPQNADSGEIFGVELNYQQAFTMLPAPFDGLGISLGYTYSDSEATVFDRDSKLPFFLQSEHVANLVFFYERGDLGLRLGYSYKSEYLDALGDSPATDLYVDEHGQLDFKASYDFGDMVTVFLQGQNLNDEPLRFYSGDKSRLAENEFYSWNAMLGVQVKF
jgi:TonB-dependent receptor